MQEKSSRCTGVNEKQWPFIYHIYLWQYICTFTSVLLVVFSFLFFLFMNEACFLLNYNLKTIHISTLCSHSQWLYSLYWYYLCMCCSPFCVIIIRLNAKLHFIVKVPARCSMTQSHLKSSRQTDKHRLLPLCSHGDGASGVKVSYGPVNRAGHQASD